MERIPSGSPFSPTTPISDPERLVGRESPLRQTLQWLDAGRNVIITGDRGVGKTSLISVIAGLLRTTRSLTPREGPAQPQADCLVALCTCSGGIGIEAVVDTLISSLSRSSGLPLGGGETSSKSVSGGLPFLKAEIRREQQSAASRPPLAKLVEAVARLGHTRRQAADLPRVVFLIDEADQVDEAEHLGSFVRSASELLRSEGLARTSFVTAGQRTLLRRLEDEHPSVLRASELLHLGRLSVDECRKIVLLGERDAGISFEEPIRDYIATSARGFPAVVHRLADSCCDVDTDRRIDAVDFEEALGRCQSRLQDELPFHDIYKVAGVLGQEILWILASHSDFLAESDLLEKIRHPPDTTMASVRMLESAHLLEREGDFVRVRDRLLSALISLSEIRQRDLGAVEALAAKWGEKGWQVSERVPGAYRGIDIVARRQTPMFRRTVGIAYVGPAEFLERKPLSLIASHFTPALSLYQLDELLLVGDGLLTPEKADLIEGLGNLRYVPWQFVDRVTGLLPG